jgi:GNAT superfamily N-acetyltransferase
MIHHPAPTPSIVAEKYPAHVHLNLLPRLRGQGIGTRLLNGWLTTAARQESRAVHVAVNRANAAAVRFWRKLEFAELAFAGLERGRTLWMARE